jgi:hypothetical protein
MLNRRNLFAAAAGAAVAGSLVTTAQASRELKPGEWSIEPDESKGGGLSHHSTQMTVNQAYYLDARLKEFGVKVISEPVAFYEGAKVAAPSPYGTPWHQLHAEASDDFYLPPAAINNLAGGIALRGKTIRFGKLFLPPAGPDIGVPVLGAGRSRIYGICGAGRMEFEDVSLRLLTYLDGLSLKCLTRLDALFCEVR